MWTKWLRSIKVGVAPRSPPTCPPAADSACTSSQELSLDRSASLMTEFRINLASHLFARKPPLPSRLASRSREEARAEPNAALAPMSAPSRHGSPGSRSSSRRRTHRRRTAMPCVRQAHGTCKGYDTAGCYTPLRPSNYLHKTSVCDPKSVKLSPLLSCADAPRTPRRRRYAVAELLDHRVEIRQCVPTQ